MLDGLERVAGLLEQICSEPAAREQDPKRFAVYRAQSRAVLAELEMLVAAADAEQWHPSKEQRLRIAEVQDRAAELVDTFAWSVDAAEDLAALAEAECA